jgi:chemotaxis protein methyltransferase CheR
LLEQGERAEAKRALKHTLYLDPNFVLGHVALANFYRQAGDAVSSGRHMEIAHRLLSARPREEVLPESDGMTAGRLMEIIEAQRVTRQTLSKDPREGRRIAQPNIVAARTYERGRQ